jgi:hypothetical protein
MQRLIGAGGKRMIINEQDEVRIMIIHRTQQKFTRFQ